MTKEETLTALRALRAANVYNSSTIDEIIFFVDCVGITPPWMEEMPPDKWWVNHRGSAYETTAVSEVDAINRVRWRLYGSRPESDLPPFAAFCPAQIINAAIGVKRVDIERKLPRDLFNHKAISKTDMLARLRRMAS